MTDLVIMEDLMRVDYRYPETFTLVLPFLSIVLIMQMVVLLWGMYLTQEEREALCYAVEQVVVDR